MSGLSDWACTIAPVQRGHLYPREKARNCADGWQRRHSRGRLNCSAFITAVRIFPRTKEALMSKTTGCLIEMEGEEVIFIFFFILCVYLPTVDPGNGPLALHCLGDIGQQFQVGVPWCCCRQRINTTVRLSYQKPFNSCGNQETWDTEDTVIWNTAKRSWVTAELGVLLKHQAAKKGTSEFGLEGRGKGRALPSTFQRMRSGRGLKLHQLSASYKDVRAGAGRIIRSHKDSAANQTVEHSRYL